jgi:hypothetical protein
MGYSSESIYQYGGCLETSLIIAITAVDSLPVNTNGKGYRINGIINQNPITDGEVDYCVA